MKTLRMLGIGCLTLLALATWSGAAHAFGLTGIGGRLGSLDPEGRDGSLAFGGHLEFEQMDTRVHLEPGFLYWSNDGLSDFNPNMDLSYHFAPDGAVSPYVGAGAALHSYSSDGPGDPGTDVGANLFGGVLFPSNSARFFIEGRYAATDRSQASFFGGVTLPLMR
jgi:hypothetical protein